MVKNNVKAFRQKLGMTLEQLSSESGISISTLSEIEHGTEPLVRTAQKIARALSCEIDDLWPEN